MNHDTQQCSISQRLKCSVRGLRGVSASPVKSPPDRWRRIQDSSFRTARMEPRHLVTTTTRTAALPPSLDRPRQSIAMPGWKKLFPRTCVRACFSRPFDSIRALLKFLAGARVERRKIQAGARSPDGQVRSRLRGTGTRSKADAVAAKAAPLLPGRRERVAPPCTHRSILLELMMMKIQRMSKNLPFLRCYGIPAIGLLLSSRASTSTSE